MTDLLIIGGGITGLSTAYIAAKAGKSVVLLEASSKPGGLLNTFEIGNTRLEFFYHHFFTHDAELHWLFTELGIADRVNYSKSTMGVYTHSKIFNLNTPFDLFRIPYIKLLDKFKFGLSSIYLARFANWRKMENVKAIDWLNKYSGVSATETIWAPLLKVKFGKYASHIPISWMIGRMSQRLRSRKNGSEMLGYLDGSLDVLLASLIKRLTEMGVTIVSNEPVTEIIIRKKRVYEIKTSTKTYKAKKYLFTAQTTVLGNLVKDKLPGFSERLLEIKYFGAVCTIIETKNKLSDIYWINVADPQLPFGGIIEQTNLVSPDVYGNRHITYLSRYFTPDEPLATMSEEKIKKLMLSGLHKVFPNLKKEKFIKVHVFKTNSAAVVCPVNFSKSVPNCKSPLGNLYLASMAHIYPDERSCNNSIRVAAEACRVMGINSSFVPTGSSLSGQIGM